MTKFYTDKKKRIRPLTNRQPSVRTMQTGVAHLSVPKKLSSKHLNKSSLQSLLTNYSQRSVNGNLYRVTRFRGNRNSYRILVDVTKFHNGSKPDYDLKIEKDGKEVLVKSYGTEEELLNTLQEYTK